MNGESLNNVKLMYFTVTPAQKKGGGWGGGISDRISKRETDGKKEYTERVCVASTIWNRVREVLISNIGR
jgi:hypothetical protein